MTTPTTPAVVAGVDGSASSRRAARWAATEAAALGAPLRLVNVHETTYLATPAMVPVPTTYIDAIVTRGQTYLDEERSRVLATHPALDVITDQRGGYIPAELVTESESARMIVLGSRGLGGFTGLLVGSNSVTLAAHSHCPVVVVRGEGPASPESPVVVGVDGTKNCHAAVGFAFEHARRHGARLVAVAAWREPAGELAGVLRLDAETRDRTRDRLREVLVDMIGEWSQRFEDVPVEAVLTQGRPARVLMEHTASARLVVVGSRGRGAVRGMVLGSTSHALLHHADCPVAVVRA